MQNAKKESVRGRGRERVEEMRRGSEVEVEKW